MSKVFYELNEKDLTATLWVEGNEKQKEVVKGEWQTYSGERASKNNTRIIFKKLPSFCEPQKTLTLDPKEPKSSFVPKLNTKTHSTATKKVLFEYTKIENFTQYLEEEADKKTFTELYDKAKKVFEKKQAEANKTQINTHLQGLEKLGLSPEALIELLKAQLKATENKENTENTENKGADSEKI